MHKLVSIIIVNWNGKKETLAFLESLGCTDYPNYEIIVVDNASTDGSVYAIKKRFPKVRIARSRKNLGYGPGLNFGMRRSKAEYVVGLVNDMITFQPGWLSEAVRVAETDEKIGMVASIWVRSDDHSRIQQRVHLKLGGVSEKMMELFGGEFFGFGMIERGQKIPDYLPDMMDIRWGNGLMRRKIIKNIGMYDEKLFMNYEGNDLGYRLRKAGYRVVLATKSRLQHEGGVSIRKMEEVF